VIHVLTDEGSFAVDARIEDDALWISPVELEGLTGYELKPEGACRDDVCVPLPDEVLTADAIDVAGLWRHIGSPVLHDAEASVWMLAQGSTQRRAALDSLYAPDFTLPDLHGIEHSLSDFRGKKVFLATWASW
jgi:hypothetical protein